MIISKCLDKKSVLVLLFTVLVFILLFIFCSCGSGSSDSEKDGDANSYANTYQLIDMNIGLSDLWVFRTVAEAKEDINLDDVVPEEEVLSNLAGACFFYDSMNTEHIYQCFAMDNSDGAESVGELKEGLEQEYSDSTLIDTKINEQPAVEVVTTYDNAVVKQYMTVYGGYLYTIRYIEYEPGEMDESTKVVFKGITFGDSGDENASDKGGSSTLEKNYKIEDLSVSLDDSWEEKSMDEDGDYSFASQKNGDEADTLLSEKAFEKTSAGQAVLVYCMDSSSEDAAKNTNEAKKNLIDSGKVDSDEIEDITIDGEAAIRTETEGTYEGIDWTYLNVYTIHNNKLYEIYCPFTKDDVDMTPYYDQFIKSISFIK